ncbi:indole-3-acetic acid-induced protein ARG7-like [Impatiens glandulifera]|uniref:indole-3-acetic acid-induced protein ARG7-like n=1 Tax=Impatiens glandulifera TaxID=253017 RepID=UPI001FB0F23A|nr:indole-3-acetic acid-induced protein ARG7-like [Impatiens glandulifera]
MDSNKSNKISDIVKLRRLLKKWKKASNHDDNPDISYVNSSSGGGGKSINKFLKKTLSFSDLTSSGNNNVDDLVDVVPKGCLAVCVGKEMLMKRYIIPTEYLSHHEFRLLLREAEEEFGFQQGGVLRIPCELPFFDNILKIVQDQKS